MRGPFPLTSGEMAATVLGRVAAGALQSDSSWDVAAVFRRSFYCRSHAGSFVCFGPTSLNAGPLNVLCQMPEPIDWEAARLTTGSAATCDGARFRVAERFIVSLSRAAVWRPPRFAPWSSETIQEGLVVLAHDVRTRPARGGLQAVVPVLTGNAVVSPVGSLTGGPFLRMAMEGIKPLAAWLETRLAHSGEPLPIPFPALDALIGLGPGLTPSGDDFLVGVLVALHHLGIVDVAGDLAQSVLARAKRRTNDISRAHLAAAAEGEGLAPIHLVLASLCAPGVPELGLALSAVDAIGHTSGWDATAGVALAAATAARVRAVRDGMWVAA